MTFERIYQLHNIISDKLNDSYLSKMLYFGYLQKLIGYLIFAKEIRIKRKPRELKFEIGA